MILFITIKQLLHLAAFVACHVEHGRGRDWAEDPAKRRIESLDTAAIVARGTRGPGQMSLVSL